MLAIYIGVAFVSGAVLGMIITALLIAREEDDRP